MNEPGHACPRLLRQGVFISLAENAKELLGNVSKKTPGSGVLDIEMRKSAALTHAKAA